MEDHTGRPTFGQLVRAAREARGWSRSDLGVFLGNLGTDAAPRSFGDSRIQRLENDQQRYKDPALVRRLVEVLNLDPRVAWLLAFPEIAAAVLKMVTGDPQPGPDGQGPTTTSSACKTVLAV